MTATRWRADDLAAPVTLGPLRWKLDHDCVRDADGVLHRPNCERAGPATPLRAGQVIEQMRAPTACPRCYPAFETLLGPVVHQTENVESES